MLHQKKALIVGLVGAIGLATSSGAAHALDCRNIEMIATWGAGGGTDIFMRAIAGPLSEVLDVPVKVINVTGAMGESGRQELMSRPADGCSLVNVEPDTMTGEILGQTEISLITDLIPVFRAHVDIGLIHAQAGEFGTWDELVTFGEANPGTLNMGGVGTVGSDRAGIELTLQEAGIDNINYIPYDSAATMHADLLGGRLHGMYDEMSAVKDMVEAEQIEPLIVINDKRLGMLPDVPAAGELGYEVSYSNWRGLAVKEGTPEETVAELSDALMEAAQFESYREYESSRVLDLVEDGQLGHEEFEEVVQREFEQLKQMLQDD